MNRSIERALALCALSVSFVAVVHAQNLVVNGSFENPARSSSGYTTYTGTSIPGWTVEFGTVDIVRPPLFQLVPAYDGAQWVDMNGSPGRAAIYQDINLTDGLYTLSFAMNGNYDERSPEGYRQMRVEILQGLTVIFSEDFTHNFNSSLPRAQQVWDVHSRNVTLSAGTYRLRFESLENRSLYHGPALDDVRLVQQVPCGCPDLNQDSLVDDADLLIVLFNFGTTGNPQDFQLYQQGDVNCDGVVDDADLLEVLFAFGSGCE